MPRIVSRVVAVGLLWLATAGRCVAGQTGHYAYHTDTFRNRDGHAIDQVTIFPNVPRLRRTVDGELGVSASRSATTCSKR